MMPRQPDELSIASESTCAPPQMHAHHHNCYELIYVTAGEAVFTIEGRRYTARPNDLLFISNHERHERTAAAFPYSRYYLLISPGRFSSLFGDREVSSVFRLRPDGFSHLLTLDADDRETADRLFERMLREYLDEEPLWEDCFCACLRLLFALLFRHYRGFFPLAETDASVKDIMDAQNYIDLHCSEPLTLQSVASQFYMDRFHLSHRFRTVTGYTFQEYLIRARLSAAKDRLAATSDSVTETAGRCGFGSVSGFIRLFRKYVGVTPRAYRASLGAPPKGDPPSRKAT